MDRNQEDELHQAAYSCLAAPQASELDHTVANTKSGDQPHGNVNEPESPVDATDDRIRVAHTQNPLDTRWILNLGMKFRDNTMKEKFFITYTKETGQRYRVTVTIDYRNALPDSLESDMTAEEYQKDRNALIYQTIEKSLNGIQFYDTVTNLKLYTELVDRSEADAETKTMAGVEASAAAETETTTRTNAETDAETNAVTKAKANAMTDAEPKAHADAEEDTEAEADTDTLTTTNTDTQTTVEGGTKVPRLHVHVTEDTNEVVHFPRASAFAHLANRGYCWVRYQSIAIMQHLSGFVYKVVADGRVCVMKEIPGPDTVEEFQYEVEALTRMKASKHVIDFIGLVIDDHSRVRALLIDYATGGALFDTIYDTKRPAWSTRAKLSQHMLSGLNDIHNAGFVQGDHTLSNLVTDENGDLKTIDINRRGCPVGWEPPEIQALIASGQSIRQYIGVKSDLYQAGICLWAIAQWDDEPEQPERPGRGSERPERQNGDLEQPGRRERNSKQPKYLSMDGFPDDVPEWFRDVIQICLNSNPCDRKSADKLLAMFPAETGPEVCTGVP